ncbi:hypothetical protein SteCoe_31673 [Stentor coeruleus]|uniref:PKD/REJ-like domain-containing protein n=1 Tax=Stentor coeruleus TaxID=5963 RepID=A0A1R2B0Q6_9CILI|nr:hypothetical protein SteCoe_31673 [Stentor coeruleus]
MMFKIFMMVLGTLGSLIPTIQNNPPVSDVCSSFSIDILTIDSSTGATAILVQTINVNIYYSSGTLHTSKSCSLVDITGCSISGYSISASGSYYAQVQDTSGVILSSISTFTVSSVVKQITIATSNASPSANFDFFLTAKIKDLCGTTITASSVVTLSGSIGFVGTTSITTTTGVAIFQLHYTLSGDSINTFTCGSTTASLTVTIKQDLIKITSVSPVPYIVNGKFNITAKVCSNNGASIENLFGPYTLTLSLSPADTILGGTLVNTTTSGATDFYDIFIDLAGTYQIVASATDMISGYSISYVIDALVMTVIDITCTNTGPSTYFTSTVNLKLYDQIGRDWVYNSDVFLTGDSSLVSSVHTVSAANLATLTFSYSSSGTKIVTITTEGLSNTTTINVKQNKALITSLNPIPFLTINSFSVSIGIYDNSGTTLESSYGIYSITLILQPTGTFVGSLSGTTSNGIYTFNSLYITTTGSYNIQATGTDLIPVSSSTFLIVELMASSLTIIPPLSISVNFDFDLNVVVLDQFGSPWTNLVTITLDPSIALTGILSQDTNTGTALFPSLMCEESGFNKLRATSGVIFTELYLTIQKDLLIITWDLGSIIYVDDLFDLTVSVYDYDGLILENKYGPYIINLYLYLNDTLITTITETTISGSYLFTGLSAPSPGLYEVIVESADCYNSSKTLPEVLYGRVQTIQVLPQSSSVEAKFMIDIPIILYNKTSLEMPYAVNTKIYLDDLLLGSGDILGQGTIPIYFNNSGTYTLTVIAEDVTQTFSIQIFESSNLDPMCLIAKTSTICLKCLTNTNKLVKGICECIYQSYYDQENNVCVCIEGLIASNGYCITCGNYFAMSDLRSYYTKDYLSIMVSFQERVNTTDLKTCEDIIIMDEYMVDLAKSCQFIDPMTLQVQLTAYPDLNKNYIEINCTKVQKVGDECDMNIETLLIVIDTVYNLPKITAYISAPDEYSSKCSYADLIIKANPISSLYKYKWTHTLGSELQMGKIIQESSKYYIAIPYTIIVASDFKVEVTVSITGMDVSSKADKDIKISDSENFFVAITSDRVTIKTTDSLLAVAYAENLCSQTQITYLWGTSSNVKNFKSILSNTLRNDYLLVLPGSLKSDDEYQFYVTGSSGSYESTATLYVQVVESNLEIWLSRPSGHVPSTVDFIISAFAKDPDDDFAVITYVWECLQDYSTCLDANLKKIELSADDGILTIPALVLQVGTVYQFTATASTLYKSISTSIYIQADTSIDLDLYLPTPTSLLSQNLSFKSIPFLSSSTLLSFLWTITGLNLNLTDIDLTTPYLQISGQHFTQGETYTFALSLKTLTSDYIEILYFNIYCNLGPICETITVEKPSGLWVITASCTDGDNNNYPLTYQYGSILNNIEIYIQRLSLRSQYVGYLRPSDEIVVKVCDNLLTCNRFYYNYTETRRVEDINVDVLINLMEDLDKVPSSIIILQDFTVSNSEFLYMVTRFSDYYTIEPMSTNALEVFLDCLKALLSHKKNVNIVTVKTLQNILGQVVNRYDDYMTEGHIEKIFACFYEFISLIDPISFMSILEEISHKAVMNSLPDSFYKVTLGFELYSNRIMYPILPSMKVKLTTLTLTMPKVLECNITDILDLHFFGFQVNGTFYVSVKIKNSGIYSNYNLQMSEPYTANINLTEGFIIKMTNPYGFNNSLCVQVYDKTSCDIIEITENSVTVQLDTFGDYKIYDYLYICIDEYKAVSIMGSLILFTILIFIFLIIEDWHDYVRDEDFNHFFTIFPLTSLTIPQNKPSRALSLIQISTSLLVLLSSFQIIRTYLLTETKDSYKIDDFYIGIISFGASQIFSFASFTVNSLNNTKTMVWVKIVYFMTVIIGNVVYIVFYSLSSCESENMNWVFSYVVFGIFDVFIVQMIIAGILSMVLKPKNLKGHRNGTMPEEVFNKRSNTHGPEIAQGEEEIGQLFKGN